MARPAAVLLIVVAVVIAVAGVVLMTDDDAQSWSISYETGGGQLPEGSPTGYTEGDSFSLPEPVMDGHVFRGWFSDPDLTDRVQSIVPGMSGDLVLHACWIPAVEHTVTYVLDGGRLPDDASRTFVGGVGMTLPVPERDGYRFAGWFEDDDFTTPVVVLGRDVLSEITVYACWDPDDRVGTGLTWDVSGEYYNGSIRHTMSGTVSQECLAERDGAYYIQTRYDVTYSWPGGSSLNDSVTGGWVGTGTAGLTYVGVEEANGYTCTVWDDEDGQRYWLYHLDLQVRIAVTDGSTDIVYDLTETYGFVPETEFVPRVSVEYPLRVTGVGAIGIGDTLVLTASGDGFTGWYSGDELLTEDRTLVVERADPTGTYEARAADGYLVLDPGTETLDSYGFGTGTTVTDSQGVVVSGDLSELSPGYYMAEVPDGNVTRYMEFFVDEVRELSWTWSLGGTEYTVSLEVRLSDVYRYTYDDPYGNVRIAISDPEYVATFHTSSDRYILDVAGQLSAQAPSMDRAGFARLVLSFAQCVDYVTDMDSAGRNEYWKYPLETLWDGGGDCEDKAILCGALMMACGYDVAFVLFDDHAMTAVDVDVENPGHWVEQDGRRYVLCETTSDWDIGRTSPGHAESDILYWCPVGSEDTV